MKSRLLLASSGLLVAALAPQACSSCFGAATRVKTRRGLRRIDSLSVGDEVVSWTRDGGLCSQPILRIYRHAPQEVFQLGDSPLSRVTANHPIFRASNNDFVRADELMENDELLEMSDSGVRTRVVNGAELPPVNVEPVFNLQVAQTETYFAEGILVHNKTDAYCQGEPAYCDRSNADRDDGNNIVFPGEQSGGSSPTGSPILGGAVGMGGLGGSENF